MSGWKKKERKKDARIRYNAAFRPASICSLSGVMRRFPTTRTRIRGLTPRRAFVRRGTPRTCPRVCARGSPCGPANSGRKRWSSSRRLFVGGSRTAGASERGRAALKCRVHVPGEHRRRAVCTSDLAYESVKGGGGKGTKNVHRSRV